MALIQPPFPPPPPSSSSARHSSLSLFEIHVFISSPHVYITYTSLSKWELERVWHRLRCNPILPSTHNTPSHKEHIPPSSCRKDTHLPRSQIPAMFSGNVAPGFSEPPLRRPAPPPTGAKNATNYWGSSRWSLSFNPWQVPLGGYQDVNGRDRAVWHKGLGGFQRCTSSGWTGLVTSAMFWHHALLNIHEETLSLSIKNPQKWQLEVILTPASLCVIRWWLFKFKFFIFVLSLEGKKKKNGGGAQERGRVWDTAFLPALSGRHEKMSERVPEAALVWFILICTDEPCWPWPGNHQPAPTLSTQSSNERSADQ